MNPIVRTSLLSALLLTLVSQPTSPSAQGLSPIILSDDTGGLKLVSAPDALPLSVGHVVYLPVEVQGYHRPIAVGAQVLIHTYVNDVTLSEPGETSAFTVTTLESPQGELKLQTLRMRPHTLTLFFTAAGETVSATLTLQPTVQPHTPLFGVQTPFMFDPPFTLVYGPDCGSCSTTPGDPPGTTRDRVCYRNLADTCRCHYYRWVLEPESDARIRHNAPQVQRYAVQFKRSVGGMWSNTEIEPGQYLLTVLDWVYGSESLSPQERDYSPLITDVMYGGHGWMSCPAYMNPDGSSGFYDVDNAYLLERFRAYIHELNVRYAAELRFVEMGNEPAAEFYLCPCGVTQGTPCDASGGPNQPVCLAGPGSEEFAAVYGDLLFTAADIAAKEMAAANPQAVLVTGALEMVPTGDRDLTATTEYMLRQGLLARGNVVIGIHQYPYFYPPPWLQDESGKLLNCAYYQPGHDVFWLPDGCETAPPLEGSFLTANNRTFTARDLWQRQDEHIDLSGLLRDAEALGVLDRFYLFDTELHAGFHDGDPTTGPAREALAGLRIGTINAHQRVLGSEFIFSPDDPTVYNLMVKHLAGATPVYAWDAPLMDSDYSGIVYKLFTRGDEDILAVWSNAEETLALALTLADDSSQFKQITLTGFQAVLPHADLPEQISVGIENYSVPPALVPIQPLKAFYFLSVISDRPGFGWLANLESTSDFSPGVTPSPAEPTRPPPTAQPEPPGRKIPCWSALLLLLTLVGLVCGRSHSSPLGCVMRGWGISA